MNLYSIHSSSLRFTESRGNTAEYPASVLIMCDGVLTFKEIGHVLKSHNLKLINEKAVRSITSAEDLVSCQNDKWILVTVV